MNYSSNLNDILEKFSAIGFSVKELTENADEIILERTVERNNTHQITLEDHRWERACGFDPKRDVGEWLIFSMLTDDERDWFGHFVETQYPLTLPEIKLVEELIDALEKEQKRILDEKCK